MRIITRNSSLYRAVQSARARKHTIGFVPTMGFLHDGHLSLMRHSKNENDLTVVSVFVNPKQFVSQEDLKQYPRDKKRDELLVRREKVDIMFYPTAEEMYPEGFLTYVRVEKMSGCLCGKYREGHFQGVTTIVAKLLNLVSPDTLYLGQKDAQQAVIIQTMVKDLNFPVHVKVLPTIREKDGLAMSSRNSLLTVNERKEAPVLFYALRKAEQAVRSGERSVKNIQRAIEEAIERSSVATVQYVECVDAQNLKSLSKLRGKVLISLAAWFGKTRLIDNIVVDAG